MGLVRDRSKMEPTASVIISTWRRKSALRKLLFSIARQRECPPIEVVVVDSHSGDGSASTVESFCRRVFPVRIIHTVNALAAKRNAGARVANSALLLFLDDDLLLEDRFCLGAIVREAGDEKAPVCFRVEYPAPWRARSTYYRFKQLGHDLTNFGPRELPTFRFVAMAFCISRALYWEVGGFSEQFYRYGGEDHAFELGLRRIGIVPLMSRSAAILHCEDSRSFSRYRLKLIETSSGAMATLLQHWPEAYDHAGIQTLEAPLIRHLIKITPLWLLQVISRITAYLMDLLPGKTSDAQLCRAGRAFTASAYLVGMKLRNRI
jgi:glycosyltransferase involved in cell wall biosynthesis